MTTLEVPAGLRENPYFGLEFYDEKSGPWFFGRDAECGKVIANLQASRLTLLHAESGAGKSSLLRAGVAWRMRRQAADRQARRRPVRAVPVVFSYWKDDPASDLAIAIGQAIRPYLGDRDPELSAGPLDEVITAAAQACDTSLYIMLDQFEEYFLYRSGEPQARQFADELARCINRTDLRANFLIAIREDAYAGLGDLFKGRIANVYGNYLHIDFLDRAAAEKAIREPLAVYNAQRDPDAPVTVQDELVAAVLSEVRVLDSRQLLVGGPGSDDGRIATPLLQLVMEQVWDTERGAGSRELRLSTLEQLRGVRMIADTHLDRALKSLGPVDRQVAADMFDHLVTPSGGKIAESVSDLAHRTGRSEAQVDAVLTQLDRKRIVRPVPAPPGQDPVRFRRYEIFHDVLAAPINRAIAARAERRRTRRIRRLALVALILLLAVAGVALWLETLYSSAHNATAAAQSRQLAAEANLNVAENPELSTLLALQALQRQPTTEAQEALRAALPGLQDEQTISAGASVLAAAFDPANVQEIVSAGYSGSVLVWSAQTGRRLTILSMGGHTKTGAADAVAFNQAGSELAVGYGSGLVAIFDTRRWTLVTSVMNGGPGINDIRFVGDTKLAVATPNNVSLWRFTVPGSSRRVIFNRTARRIAVDPRDPSVLAVSNETGVYEVNLAAVSPKHPASAGKHPAPAVAPAPKQLTELPSNDAEFSSDGTELAIAEPSGEVVLDNLVTRRTVTLYAADVDAIAASFSPDGQRVVAGYRNGTALVWDVAVGLPLTVLAGNTGPVDQAVFNPHGDKATKAGGEVLTAGADGTVRIWDAQPRELRTEFSSAPSGAAAGIAGATYVADRILVLNDNNEMGLFTSGGKTLGEIRLEMTPSVTTLDRAGTEVAASDGYGNVEVLRMSGSSYVPVGQIIRLRQPTGTIELSADGSRIGITTDNGVVVEVLSSTTGKTLQTLRARDPIQQLTFSPGGGQVVGADSLGQVEVWSGAATEPRLLGPTGPLLTSVAFNRSGSEYITVSDDGTLRIWDARAGSLTRSIQACAIPFSASFSPDGTKIVVACDDGTIRVYDAVTGQTLVVLDATIAGAVNHAAFSPDGTSIVASVHFGTTGYVQVWNAELATTSLPALERIAEQRATQPLTPAEEREYLPTG